MIDDGLTVSNLSNVTIDGQGATIQAESTMAGGVHMLKFRYANDLVIQNLTLDANGLAREAHSLSIMDRLRRHRRRRQHTDVLRHHRPRPRRRWPVEAWHDGLYLDKGVERRPKTCSWSVSTPRTLAATS